MLGPAITAHAAEIAELKTAFPQTEPSFNFLPPAISDATDSVKLITALPITCPAYPESTPTPVEASAPDAAPLAAATSICPKLVLSPLAAFEITVVAHL